VVIEAATTAPDGAGGGTSTWEAIASTWALVEPVAGTERIVAGHLTGIVTHVVTMRHRADVTGGMRVLYRGRTYRVLVATDLDERRRYLALKTELETP
jgi:SPP1 family predicted phage head-tail adaptor